MPASAPTRASLLVGNGRIVRDTFSTQPETEFTLRIIPTEVDVSLCGEPIGKRWITAIAELTFVGDGRLTAGLISAYNQFSSMASGASIMGASDVPTTIHCSDGSSAYVIYASNFTSLGDLTFHPEKPIAGQHTITGVVANALSFTDSASFVTITGSSTFADSGFTSAAILRQLYNCTLASGPTGLTTFQMQDGLVASFNLMINPMIVQGVLRDYRFQGIGLTMRGIPVEPSVTQILAAMKSSGAGAVPGREESANGFVFGVTGDVDTTNHLAVLNASVVSAAPEFSYIKLRNGEMGLLANRTYASGVKSALFTVS